MKRDLGNCCVGGTADGSLEWITQPKGLLLKPGEEKLENPYQNSRRYYFKILIVVNQIRHFLHFQQEILSHPEPLSFATLRGSILHRVSSANTAGLTSV